MGCVSSSEIDEAKKFAMNLTKIGVAKWDDFFAKVGEIADVLGKVYEGMGSPATEKIYYILGLYYFKNPKDINLYEALKVFLWSVSAQNEGQIVEVCQPGFVMSSPYFTIKVGKANPKLQKVADLIVKYVYTVLETGPKIPDLCKNLAELVQQGIQMQKTAKDDLSSVTTMSAFDKAKAVGNIGKGMASVVGIGKAAAELPSIILGAIDLCKKLSTEFQTIIQDSKDMGMKCIADGVTKQRKILLKYHTAEKFGSKDEYLKNLAKLKLDKKFRKKKQKKEDKKDKKKEEKKDKKKEEKKDKKKEKKEEKQEKKEEKQEKKEEKLEEKKEQMEEQKQ